MFHQVTAQRALLLAYTTCSALLCQVILSQVKAFPSIHKLQVDFDVTLYSCPGR